MADSLAATIKNAQQGDSSACERIVEEFSGLIRHECSRYRLSQHPDWSQSDLYQEAVIQVLSRIDRFQGTEKPEPRPALEQWIRVTTRNWLSNLERHRKAKKRFPNTETEATGGWVQPHDDLQDPARTVSSVFVRDEEVSRMQAVMNEHLDDRAKKIIELRIVEGLMLTQIAERLELTYDQVRYSYETSLAELQKHMS